MTGNRTPRPPRFDLPASTPSFVPDSHSTKTRLVWRAERLRLLALAVVLFGLWLLLLLSFAIPAAVPVLIVSAGAFILTHIIVWCTRFLASRK